MKNISEVAVGLAYSALVLRDQGLAAEVRHLEDRLDEMKDRLELWVLRASNDRIDPAPLRGLLHLSQAAEDLGDAAQQMVWLIEEKEELHPILSIALGDSDEVVVRVPVAEGSEADGSSLSELQLDIEPGFHVLAVQRGGRYLYRPRGDVRLRGRRRADRLRPRRGPPDPRPALRLAPHRGRRHRRAHAGAAARRPRRMTYSIVARCPDTGQLGVAVQSHFFSTGAVVPWLEAGVGAVATQATAEVAHGPDGLARLRAGRSPAEALADVLGPDEHAETRQVAIVDATGRAAAHTGGACIEHAGHVVGDGFTVQANMMDGRRPGGDGGRLHRRPTGRWPCACSTRSTPPQAAGRRHPWPAVGRARGRATARGRSGPATTGSSTSASRTTPSRWRAPPPRRAGHGVPPHGGRRGGHGRGRPRGRAGDLRRLDRPPARPARVPVLARRAARRAGPLRRGPGGRGAGVRAGANGDRWQELVRRLPAADLLPAEAVAELLAPQM